MPDPSNPPISKARQLQLKLAAREAERLRIGQDLHDAFGGNLTGASLLLAKVSRQFTHATAEQADTLQQLREIVTDSQRKLQQIIQDLRPPELEGGLAPALHLLCSKWQAYTSLTCDCSINDEQFFNLALNAEQALALYRIAQEALNNVARHAQASVASVELLREDAGIVLKIADNGKAGAKKHHAGAGLTGMNERVAAFHGQLRYEALQAGGHCLTASLPLEQHKT